MIHLDINDREIKVGDTVVAKVVDGLAILKVLKLTSKKVKCNSVSYSGTWFSHDLMVVPAEHLSFINTKIKFEIEITSNCSEDEIADEVFKTSTIDEAISYVLSKYNVNYNNIYDLEKDEETAEFTFKNGKDKKQFVYIAPKD